MNKIIFGADAYCLQPGRWKNSRLGMVTNHAATTTGGKPSRQALLQAGCRILKLFSPEHGLDTRGIDGAPQANRTDRLTGLPVISLYGEHLQPTATDMEDIDALLFDIPDVGCRFYTYLWTMTYVMEACAAFGKKMIVLDRPNPAGGLIEQAEGPLLDENRCASFIGRWNIPVRHSCTLGELALFFAATRSIRLNLEVMPVSGWARYPYSQEPGWHFVPTSPAIKDAATILLYPGMGMLEGINVNEGRGTETPFKKMGAPWIKAAALKDAVDGLALQGLLTSTVNYIPSEGLYAGEHCYGLHVDVDDPAGFRPVAAGLALLQTIVQLYPDDCSARLYPTVANPSGGGHLDKLTGVYDAFRLLKEADLSTQTALNNEWRDAIAPYLLY
jgi:uncharacterized protein YbbC (DUF1343 family)